MMPEPVGIDAKKAQKVTGFGHRRLEGCKPDDTILNKVVAGALSIEDAQRVLGMIE